MRRPLNILHTWAIDHEGCGETGHEVLTEAIGEVLEESERLQDKYDKLHKSRRSIMRAMNKTIESQEETIVLLQETIRELKTELEEKKL